ncbi:MAG TPA: hypothetical protein VFZ79_19995, partial [Acidimicrobiales bacterium]
NSPGTGITATIDIPTTLLTTDTDLADPITPPHGHRTLPTPTPQPPPTTNGGNGHTDWSILTSPAASPGAGPVPSEVSRTQSGLVKRAARPGGSTTVGAGQPSGDLLDSLRRHTANLQVDRQAGAAAPTPPGPPRARTSPPSHAAQPPPARPPAGPPVAPTAGGLARRVRGAQLPTGEPVRLRRDGAPGPAPGRPVGAPPSRPPVPSRQPDDRPRSADDVYNFLSRFSAGVRRGLDESSSRPPQPGGPPGPGW